MYGLSQLAPNESPIFRGVCGLQNWKGSGHGGGASHPSYVGERLGDHYAATGVNACGQGQCMDLNGRLKAVSEVMNCEMCMMAQFLGIVLVVLGSVVKKAITTYHKPKICRHLRHRVRVRVRVPVNILHAWIVVKRNSDSVGTNRINRPMAIIMAPGRVISSMGVRIFLGRRKHLTVLLRGAMAVFLVTVMRWMACMV